MSDTQSPSNISRDPEKLLGHVDDAGLPNVEHLPSNRPDTPTYRADDGSSQGEDPDRFVVWWTSPEEEDPTNPMNWSEPRKWGIIAVVSFISFLTPLASSMFAPGVPDVMEEFGTSSSVLSGFVVSVFVLGFAFGPLVVAPLSEVLGRVIIYNVSNVLFLVFTIACAESKSMGMLIAFRFLAGFVGVTALTCGGGTVADLMPQERRGGAIAIWSLGPLFGPIIGPVTGGFLIEAKGWRWAFWVIAIVAGATLIFAFFTLRETYAPVILERKAARLRKETGNNNYRSKLASDLAPRDLFLSSVLRPTQMLLFSPIVTCMSIYLAVMYGLLYILFTTFTFVFEDVYGFSSAAAGLTFLGSGAGMITGLAVSGIVSDRLLKRQKAKGVSLKPEHRLPLLLTVPACLCLPAGLFIYGWGAEKHAHWMVLEVGTAIIGTGMIIIMMSVQTYLVDAFTVHAASALAANTVLRSLMGSLLPLCGLQIYDRLGLGWGNSLLAFIALGLSPIPVLFRIFGERIRTHSRMKPAEKNST
ncbi:hypothetical protein ARAM_003065 [Aspergillus rambellii]|uniref:Major facilitator superfamily (MFS) profile domain-containing protein n=1 Tax=Aspergillus rambellii TaxID=308745 RepID=A0A0F8V0F3_9EURO|nr:hypothetical protein ARAM_003065 [Aspergillus rambellii]